jgi:hypothetical protein
MYLISLKIQGKSIELKRLKIMTVSIQIYDYYHNNVIKITKF